MTVIVAARDEAARIAATIAGLRRAFPAATIWLADDGSRDRTAAIARAQGARVVGGGRPVGKGGAMTAAAREALRQRGAASAARAEGVFVLCDGDLAGSAEGLAELARAVADGEADLAVAAFARRVGGGFGIALGFARWAIRRRCGLRTRAPISGQRALRAGVLAAVLPFAPGYGMEIGMTIDAVRAGYRVRELQLDLSHRASARTAAGFAHRARQLADFARVYRARSRRRGRGLRPPAA
ncbi:MAG TPA: glycosyltransferase [Solirubrobacteraceae bacterium]|nr:glycosyltransferase [Solirubrobacteraceae bacterium]